jgi:hypothetical protein
VKRPLGARIAVLASGLGSAMAQAACLAVASPADGTMLATLEAPTFDVVYVHSVTRTPVVEHYLLDERGMRQTSMRFREHGPGLPTEADAGQSFTRTPDGVVVTLDRRFERIVMRVHADQSPRLVAGGTTLDLARWGNRALELRAAPCTSH